jgi:GT2 family glycosyltransferase
MPADLKRANSIDGALGAGASISIVVLTHSRCHLLRQCVENVLLRTSPLVKEILIWDNASTDDTGAYLDSLTDPRITVVHHPTNIGVNAYSRAFPRTSGTHLIEVDDDLIGAPENWDERLFTALEGLPHVGYLAANLELNPHDVTSNVLYGVNAHMYRIEEVNGFMLKLGGPVGGWCSITSRELHDRVGGWSERDTAFWQEEGLYIASLERIGYVGAYLDDLRVVHAGGPHYSRPPAEKMEYWRAYNQRVARKNAVKRFLLAIPPVRRLNERHSWFQPPRTGPDYVQLYGG